MRVTSAALLIAGVMVACRGDAPPVPVNGGEARVDAAAAAGVAPGTGNVGQEVDAVPKGSDKSAVVAGNDEVTVDTGETGNAMDDAGTTPPAAPAPPEADAMGPDLLSLAAGAVAVSATSEHNSGTLAMFAIDGRLDHVWQANTDLVEGQHSVFELAEQALLTRLGAGHGPDAFVAPGQGVAFAVADAAEGPWRELGQVAPAVGASAFLSLEPAVTARFVRVTLPARANLEAPPVAVGEVFAEGTFVTAPATADFKGHWNGGWLVGMFRLEQDGIRIKGCFTDGRQLEGTVDGRVANLRYRNEHGFDVSGVFVLSASEEKPFLLQIFESAGAAPAEGYGLFSAVDNVDCTIAGEKGEAPPKDPIEVGLENDRRALVYDILFDFNKDTLRPESAAVLDRIATALKNHPDWTIAVEGHTDAVGSASWNQGLSERRAAAALKGLVERGIDAKRISSGGFGASRPVADNATSGGRAKNRRVELVRTGG